MIYFYLSYPLFLRKFYSHGERVKPIILANSLKNEFYFILLWESYIDSIFKLIFFRHMLLFAYKVFFKVQ